MLNELTSSIENPDKVKITYPNDIPIILGDTHRIELLFYHLLHNSIKFNNKGREGVVQISWFDEGDYWKFIIKDNGKGIEKEYFDKIFIAFQKLENDYKSTGIGLSIVKKIVEAYKGDINLESTPNIETKFIFTLKK